MALLQLFRDVRTAVSAILLAFLSWSPKYYWNSSRHFREEDSWVQAAIQALGSPAQALLLIFYWPHLSSKGGFEM